MKLLTFRDKSGQPRVAQLAADGAVLPLSYPDGRAVSDLVKLIGSDVPLASLKSDAPALDLASVRLLAPIPKPARNLFCVGKNYTNHAQEFTRSGFDADQTAETVIAHGDRIWDAAGVSDALDYETELAVIIGKGG